MNQLENITKEFKVNDKSKIAPSVYAHLMEVEKLILEFRPTGQKQASKTNTMLFHLRQALKLWKEEVKASIAKE